VPHDEPNDPALAAFTARPRPLLVRGAVQNYAWGGYDLIPGLLGTENPERRPCAELWIGAHPMGPARVQLGESEATLETLVASAPESVLGRRTAARFQSRLPYLLKVLDVRCMLSIQAHPTRSRAEEGFLRENRAGVPLDAPTRSYRDDNHKPEAHVALTELWMLHGFRPLPEIAGVLAAVPELSRLMPDFHGRLFRCENDGDRRALLRSLYEHVMTMSQDAVDAVLGPLLARLAPRFDSGALARSSPDYWAVRAARDLPLPSGRLDRGILSIYLLNLVRLAPGQGTYQPPGMLHAYLEGATVEVMASSDNVLRGGLTPKHVDVPELLRTLTFESGPPAILEGVAVSDTEVVYRTPAEEFELSRVVLSAGGDYRCGGHEVDTLVFVQGAARVDSDAGALDVHEGTAVLAPADVPYSVGSAGGAVFFRATVGRSASGRGPADQTQANTSS
jgi:mannose-6-phosphate isomerase